MCKSGYLDVILSKPEDVDNSYPNAPSSSSAAPVSPGKRPRRDSMDTDTADSASQPDTSYKSPRTSEGFERPRTPSEVNVAPFSSGSSYRAKDMLLPPLEEKLSKKQRRFLRQWHETFARENQLPWHSHETLTALATLVQARPQLIHAYLQGKFLGNSPASTITTTYPDSTPHTDSENPQPRLSAPAPAGAATTTTTLANPHLPPATLTLISKYLTTCARRRSPTDGRRSVNSGPLRCTFGCGYRTSRPFDWRRHEETHAPQDLWLCTLCRNQEAQTMTTTMGAGAGAGSPFLGHRKDKFLKHVRDVHGQWEGETVLGFSRVEVGVRGGAAWTCPFCRAESAGWEERCRHVLGHFGDGEMKGIANGVGADNGEGSGESEVDGDVGMESSGESEDEGVGKGV